jgi:LPXTG-motif cell wall-anchored protein
LTGPSPMLALGFMLLVAGSVAWFLRKRGWFD